MKILLKGTNMIASSKNNTAMNNCWWIYMQGCYSRFKRSCHWLPKTTGIWQNSSLQIFY